MGFLFQQGARMNRLTVEENVEFPMRRHATLSAKNKQNNRGPELLRSVGMEQDAGKCMGDSGGMQKRVGLDAR